MKIGSHIKPRSGKARHVEIHGTPYDFTPLKDKLGVTHFVADVTEEDHAALLLENGAFYVFDKNGLPEPKLTRRAPSQPAEPAVQYPEDVVTEARALLDHTVQEISLAVGSVSSLDVVRCAILLEDEGKDRKTVRDLLATTIDAATAAGIK